MFAVSNRNIILPGPDGERLRMPRGWMGLLPAWAEKSAYLAALAADGKVILSNSAADKAQKEPAQEEPAQEESAQGRRGRGGRPVTAGPGKPAQEEPPEDRQ